VGEVKDALVVGVGVDRRHEATVDPERVAIIHVHADGRTETFTFRWLSETSNRLANVLRAKGVELRGCERSCALIDALAATEEDWRSEYLAPILSIRVVDDLDAAIEHINQYGSHHTDAIVTEHQGQARRFLAEVDSSSVMLNTPTCFADGFEYGLGAEIGISTDKLHARGPVGLEGLTCEKYVVLGDGQLRGQNA